MAYANLELDRAGAVAVLRVARPAARNALDAATLAELAAACDTLAGEAAVRAVVVTGAGDKAFSAGADIAAMAAMNAAEGHAFAQLGHVVMSKLEHLPVPVVAAVGGVAVGGGLELALACDLIVAAEEARFGQPEINLGLIPGFGGTQRLVRRVGLSRTRELVYLGQVIPAAEAARIGLVSRVVPAAHVMAEAMRLATELAGKAPLALAAAKRATQQAVETGLAEGCVYEAEAFGVVFASEDRVEGLRAFLEKRPPTWRGR